MLLDAEKSFFSHSERSEESFTKDRWALAGWRTIGQTY